LPRFISRIARRTLLPLARLYLRAIVVTCWFYPGFRPGPEQEPNAQPAQQL
jgi:hypothetical protein